MYKMVVPNEIRKVYKKRGRLSTCRKYSSAECIIKPLCKFTNGIKRKYCRYKKNGTKRNQKWNQDRETDECAKILSYKIPTCPTKSEYKKGSLFLHPDKNPGTCQNIATTQFQKLNTQYSLVRDKQYPCNGLSPIVSPSRPPVVQPLRSIGVSSYNNNDNEHDYDNNDYDNNNPPSIPQQEPLRLRWSPPAPSRKSRKTKNQPPTRHPMVTRGKARTNVFENNPKTRATIRKETERLNAAFTKNTPFTRKRR